MTEWVRYEVPAPGVARITLNRPAQANAQNRHLLYALNDALDRGAQDDAIKVLLIAAEGRHFSSGHDLSGDDDAAFEDVALGPWGGFDAPAMEGHWAREEEAYFGLCWRWRNIPKPTVVAVQGKVIAGGLMLVWPFDIVVASDDATFQDPAVAFGANGVEYFGHPWEFGVRKAKELLFTGRAITAEVAQALGMVNRVVPRDALGEASLALATEIAQQPAMGLKTAKASINQAQDAQGFFNSLRSAMGLQQLAHAQNYLVHGMAVDPSGAERVKALVKAPPLGAPEEP